MVFIKQFLIEDHKKLHKILKEYQEYKGADFEKAKNLFSAFKKRLERHIMWEEEIISPVIESSKNKSSKPQLGTREEHKRIRVLLQQIEEELLKKTTQTDLLEKKLNKILTTHNEKEEYILYPWVDSVLGKSESVEVIEKMKSYNAQL
ncbi:MAG: hypothetical protein A3I68_01985 [Candidatus Melainabacteria bacterium RIFCSPLOWO2_02_FULL_35_15]|nr:MAG: hypothetical protein A3F80_01765 [Candidatus Melainabacteria bacterium RIFCSPLOWO2_12_FULL_35_11]OGI13834.1 MAG: hypothetical protein A3I68_01985 [Candidatus Melainabacteria bacterium RIFCSPLOWO2_02_FULL_35_15]